MKHIFLRTIIALFVLVIFGCSANDSLLAEKPSEVEFRRMTYGDLEKLPEALNATQRFMSRNARNIVDTGYGFSIDLDDFVMIGSNEKHAITFRIERPEKSKFDAKPENLVLKKTSEGIYETFLIRYSLTEEDKARIEARQLVEDMDQKIEIAHVGEFDNEVSSYASMYCVKNIIGRTYTEHLTEAGTGWWELVEFYTLDCTWSIDGTFDGPGNGGPGSGGGGGDYSGGNGGNGGHTGGGGSNSGPDPILTVPLIAPKECKKMEKGLTANPDFRTKMQELSSPNSLNLNYEQAAGVMDGSPDIKEWQGAATDNPVDATALISFGPEDKFVAFFHTHPNIGAGTLPVFSDEDLAGIAKLIRTNHINTTKFVAYLATKSGTYLALTITNPQQFLDTFYLYTFPSMLEALDTGEYLKVIASEAVLKNLRRRYFNADNPNRLIKETDPNETVLKQFLNFLSEADAGIALFETDSNFTNFVKLDLNNSTNSIDRKPCN